MLESSPLRTLELVCTHKSIYELLRTRLPYPPSRIESKSIFASLAVRPLVAAVSFALSFSAISFSVHAEEYENGIRGNGTIGHSNESLIVEAPDATGYSYTVNSNGGDLVLLGSEISLNNDNKGKNGSFLISVGTPIELNATNKILLSGNSSENSNGVRGLDLRGSNKKVNLTSGGDIVFELSSSNVKTYGTYGIYVNGTRSTINLEAENNILITLKGDESKEIVGLNNSGHENYRLSSDNLLEINANGNNSSKIFGIWHSPNDIDKPDELTSLKAITTLEGESIALSATNSLSEDFNGSSASVAAVYMQGSSRAQGHVSLSGNQIILSAALNNSSRNTT